MVEEILDGDNAAVMAAMNSDVDLLKMHTSEAAQIAVPTGLDEEAEDAKQEDAYVETAMNENGFFSDANDTVSVNRAGFDKEREVLARRITEW